MEPNITLEKQTLRILFLASDPSDVGKVRLGAELQAVRNRLSNNPFFELKDRQAVKPDDVLQAILDYKPHIVHFAGHGKESGEICFEDESGKAKIIPPEALAKLFKLVREHVKCVVINACFSEMQARAISQFVPIVIGTKKEISDSAAIKFSTGFYTALEPDLTQQSLLKAFDSGCIAISFESLPEELTPIKIEGLPEVRFSSEVDTAFQSITRTKGKVFEALIRGLTLTGKRLEVSPEEVDRILKKKIYELESHEAAIIEYEKYLMDIIRDEYPLSETSILALYQLQKGLGLSNEDVTIIKNKILSDPNLTSAEKCYNRGYSQRGIGDIDKAIEYFSEAIEKDDDYSAAYFERGYCYDIKGELKSAIDDFTKAIEFDNKWELLSSLSLAYYSRARSYHAIKSDDENRQKEILALSLADWIKTLELKSNQPEAHYGRGLVYIDLNELQHAIDDFNKAVELNPNDERRKEDYSTALERCDFKLGNV
jgi:tetratricopeptide (TPR) repeat protein